jgi:amidase
MPEDLGGMDATAQAQLVRDREASPVELIEAAIERAEAVNPGLTAIIRPRYEEARAAAGGELPDGPFRGVPFLLKDLGASAEAGQSLHLGMGLLKEVDFRAPLDSFLTQRFRDAGLVTIGRTNTPELGILPTTEPRAYGPTRNPWDPERSTGGSSGGSAAAVAAGIVPFAHASDGGGSIRIPASCCGLVGLKTTRQRISMGPLIGDFASGLGVDFAITRSVRDTAALLDAVHGEAPGDPYVAPAPLRPYREELEAEEGTLRVGILTEAPVPVEVHADASRAVSATATLLGELGHEVDADVPALPDLGGPGLDPKLAFFNRYHAAQAATLAQLEIVIGREIGKDDVEPLTWAMAEEGRRLSGGDYLAAVGLHQGMGRLIAGWFLSGYDLILTPTIGELPPPLGSFDDSGPEPLDALERAVGMGAFTATFNATGYPAISLPLHWSEEGLPVGVQLVAPFGREDLLIRIAAQIERQRPWAERRPPAFAAVGDT